MLKRLMVLAVVLFALVPGLAAPAYAQELPASLQGEEFLALETALGNDIGQVAISGACSGTVGETFTLSFSAHGIATGPYPGTFTESGTVTGTLTTPYFFGGASGVALTFTTKFTIDSPNAASGPSTVTGTKVLTTTLSTGASFAYCHNFQNLFRQDGATAHLEYDATIRTPAGIFSDEGFAVTGVQRTFCVEPTVLFPCDDPGEERIFQEFFYLSTGVLPADTSGKATGGGQIASASRPLARVTFGFEVRNPDATAQLAGHCNVVDQSTGTYVKCLTVTDYQQIGNTATWEGTAEVNGEREHYRITVQDNGEPNQGLDTFSIKTDSYEAAGNVQHGNVQLHKQNLTL